jgi:hypothetical protein
MAHVRNLVCAFCGGLLLAGAPETPAATKVDEGFASQQERYGRFSRPTDRIGEGSMGHDAYHWIQWRDHPVGRTTFRCRVTYQDREAPVVDEEITYEDSVSDGYSLCGFSPRKERDPEGVYTFTQYLDGIKVAESELRIETRFLDRLQLFPWKLALIAFAFAILAMAWLGRKNPPAKFVNGG